MDEKKEPLATFYAVRNKEGRYYRTYSASRRNAGWVEKLEDAKLWTRASQARSKITTLANENLKEPVAELVEFIVREVNVVDQKERVTASRQKKAAEKAAQQLRYQQFLAENAQAEYDRAKANLEKITGTKKHDENCTCKSCMGM